MTTTSDESPTIVWRGAGRPEEYERLRQALKPEGYGLPAYPEGVVVGPCVCGSWPGGECLRCGVVLAVYEDEGG